MGSLLRRSNIQRLCIPRNIGGRRVINVIDCVDDQNRSVARYYVRNTEQLVKIAAE